MFELQNMTIEQLQEHIEEATKVLSDKVEERKSELLAELAKLEGKAPVATRKRAPAKPKYRSKKDPSQTWVGRGAEPVWLREEIAAGLGLTKEDFLIK